MLMSSREVDECKPLIDGAEQVEQWQKVKTKESKLAAKVLKRTESAKRRTLKRTESAKVGTVIENNVSTEVESTTRRRLDVGKCS